MIRPAAFVTVLACAGSLARAEGALTAFPAAIDPACRGGRAEIYDECGDQFILYRKARDEARRQDKVLLVSYGAEWCIWCHVFDAYVLGETGTFTHTYSDREDQVRDTATIHERPDHDVMAEAEALAAYVAGNFVLVHLDSRYAPGADAALISAGIDPDEVFGLPLIFTVAAGGTLAMYLHHDRVEVRRDDASDWFRGYDRVRLLEELTAMHDAAR
jgi:hypothetical protein